MNLSATTRRLLPLAFIFVALIAALSLGSGLRDGSFAPPAEAAYCDADGGPAVVTNKEEYSPLESAEIRGCGFIAYANQALTVRVTEPDLNVFEDAATPDDEGDFVYNYVVPGQIGTYVVEILDGTTVLASNTFLDASYVTPTSLTFVAILGSNPANQTFDFVGPTSCNGGSATKNQSWINTPSPSSWTNSAFVAGPGSDEHVTITVGITSSAKPLGTYTGTVTATGTGSGCTGNRVVSITLHVIQPNPTLSQSCGVDMVLVIDNSGSISSSELTQMENALNSFVNAFLPSTPTQIAVVRFNTSASVALGFSSDAATVTGAVSATNTSSGYTNWDDALFDSRTLFPNRVDNPDLIVFSSDGNPTQYGGHTGHTTLTQDTGGITALARAIEEANTAKLAGTRIITLGIGDELSSQNLAAISSPDAVTTSNFSTLAATLADMANNMCGGTITAQKILDRDGNIGTTGDQTPGVGWTMNASVNTSSPNGDDTVTPASGVTDSDGKKNFVLALGGNASSTATITETLQANHAFISASCTGASNNGSQSGNGVTGIVVGPNNIVNCKIYNKPPGIFTVNKVWSPASGSSVSVSVTCTSGTVAGGTQSVSTASPKTWTVTAFSGTPNCTATESPIPTGYTASGSPAGSCTAGLLSPGNCTITNTRNDTSFTVNKVFSPASGASVSVTVSCTSGTVGGGTQSVSTASPKTWTIQGYTVGATCTATESPIPAGYGASGSPAGTCTAGIPSPGNCTITNTLTTANFTVNKVWSPASASSVSVTVSCVSGTPVQGAQSVSTASPKTWTINGYSGTPNCTATESPIPTGYTGSGSPAGTCTAGLVSPGNCTITNTRNDTTFTVNKNWSPASGSSVSVTVSCTGGGTVVEGAQSVSTASPKTWNIQGYTSTPTCTATESPLPTGYTASGSPAGTCSSTAPGSCTITNTRNDATFTVNKNFSPASAASVSVSVSCTGGGTLTGGTQSVSTASPKTWTIQGYTSTPTCTATESPVPTGYTGSGSPAGTCAGTISGGTGSCTITNTRNDTTFTVNKNWSPASASSVSVTVSCTGGGTVVEGAQSVSTASPKTWNIQGYSTTPTCTATESPLPTGYTASGSPAGTCSSTAPGSCTITNTRNDATFTVNKNFSPASAASVSVSVSCTGGGTLTGGTQSVSTASPKTWTIQGYTSTPTCTATESPVPTGYTGSGSPAGTCSGTISGGTGSCTITNTRNDTTFTVSKVWSPANAAGVNVSVTCTSGTVGGGTQSVTTASPKTWTVQGYTVGATCTATETVPSGYTASGSPAGTCTAGVPTPGACTITNTRNDATFTVNKVWSPSSAATVSVTVSCTGGGTVVQGAQNVGSSSPQTWNIQGYSTTPTCTATESPIPTGYTANGSPAGTCSGTISGGTGSCTITNTRNDATFTVNKNFSPASAASVSVTVSCTGGGTVVGGTQSVSTASPKTWTIQGYSTTPTCTATESPVPTGYTGSGSPASTCVGTISGGTGSCTITNTRNDATFTVNKVWSPSSAATVSVTVSCTGGGTVVQGAQNVGSSSPQTWNIQGYSTTPTCTATESPIPTGYAASGSPAGTCSGTISSGTGSCTITNTQNSAQLHVAKTVTGGTTGDVTIQVSCTTGSTTVNDATATPSGDTADFTITGFSPGATCTVTETAVPGYTFSAGDCPSVILNPGDNDTCTVTNTRNDTTFTVNKAWVPASAASVSVTVSCTGGGTVVEGAQLVSTASPKTWNIQGYVTTPTCTATEAIPSGYTASGSPAGTCSNTAPGNCTITNTRNDTTFTVNKVWSPASLASVSVTVSCTGGATVVEGAQSVSTASPKTWTVQGYTGSSTCTGTEAIPAGYTANGSPAGTCTAGIPAPGSCTITNTRNDTTFTVNKAWSPASLASVSVTVSCTGGGTVVEGAQMVSTASPKTWNIQGYSTTPTCTATEAIPSGYSANGSPAGTCSNTAPGSCTITNTRNDTTFTVNKTWSPASLASVSVTVSCTGGGTVVQGAQNVSTASPQTWNIQGYVTTPTCTATEAIPSGYSANGSPAGTCSNTAPGSCTITNTRNDATFTVNKIWSPASLASVSVTVSCTGGGTVVQGAQNVSTASPQTWNIQGYTSTPTCTATEAIPSGYTANGSPAGTCSGTISGGTGSCTITNTRNDATFTVNKVWNPSSAATVSVTVSCTGGGTVVQGAQNVGSSSPQTWNIQGYTSTPTCTATEAIPSGYTASGSPAGTCSGTISSGTGSCTITNTQLGSIIVQKTTNPPGDPQSFTVNLTGPVNDTGAVTDATNHTFSNLPAGTYALAEVLPAGWQAGSTSCSDSSPIGAIVVSVGETVTCTLNNTKLGTIVIEKTTNPSGDATNFPLTLTGPTGGSSSISDATNATFINRAPGAYTATETLSAPWTMVGVTCSGGSPTPGANSVAFTLAAGATVTCTFTNQTSASFVVHKDFQPDNAGTVTVSLSCASGTASVVDASAGESGNDATFTVTGFTGNPTCTASESGVPAGYISTTCMAALISVGQCTIVNAQNTASFTVNKAWSPASAASVSVTVTCTSGTVVQGAQLVSTASPQTWTVNGYSGTPNCTATEAIPSGYSASGTPAGTCTAGLVTPGNCTITNTRNDTTFTVNKTWSPASLASVSVTVSCTGGGTVVEGAQLVSTASPKTWNIQGYVTTPTCTATEAIPSGYSASGTPAGTCSNPAPGNCTITNTRNDTTFTVNKTWVPASAASVSVTVTCTGGGTVVEGAQNVSTASPQTWNIQGYTSTPTCTATEAIPAGYSASGTPAGTCSNPAPGNCTITNTRSDASFTVNKVWSPASAASVSVTVTCSSGTVVEGAQMVSTASPQTWNVNGYSGTPTCTATEAIPSGYSANGSPAGTCTAGLLTPGNCTITNTRNDAVFTVNKIWSPASAASVSVTVTCTGGGTVVQGAQMVSTASPQTWNIQGYVSTPTCTATEAIPAGYSASGSPAGTCSNTAPGNCTITNTQSGANFTVNKVWSPASAATVSVTVTCTGGGTVSPGAQNVGSATPQTWTVSGFSGTPTCTATEAIPSGYSASGSPAGTCSNTAPGNCTITNTRNDTTFTVNKIWSDAPNAASVSVTVTCTGGGTVVEGAQMVSTASPKTWNIQGYTSTPTCTATEAVPSGYSGSGSPAGTCSAAAPGNCTITNTPNEVGPAVPFVVYKDFQPDLAGGTVTVSLSCAPNGGTVGPASAPAGETPPVTASFVVSGYIGDPMCTATETSVPAGYGTSTCQALLSAGSCTIVNVPPVTPGPTPNPSAVGGFVDLPVYGPSSDGGSNSLGDLVIAVMVMGLMGAVGAAWVVKRQ